MIKMNHLDQFLHSTHIAYFTVEIALRPEIHTYSGGLGVLAGDMARSCADLELPVVFVSLISRAGYLRQKVNGDGCQIDLADPWEPSEWMQPLDAMVAVAIEGHEVWIRPWLYSLSCPMGHPIPVLLLDTDLYQNAPEDRKLTHYLYGGDEAYRLKQEIVLGIGGRRLLQALGFAITTFHLNEGHAALLTLQLLRQFRHPAEELRPGEPAYDHAEVRERCVFTTHTPVAAGHDQFPYELVERLLGNFIEVDEIRRVGGNEQLNMTQLGLNLSGYINGVAQRHAETTRALFQATKCVPLRMVFMSRPGPIQVSRSFTRHTFHTGDINRKLSPELTNSRTVPCGGPIKRPRRILLNASMPIAACRCSWVLQLLDLPAA